MFHIDRALKTIADETRAQARANGTACLMDLRLWVELKADGSLEVSDLHTDAVLSGSLENLIYARLTTPLKD